MITLRTTLSLALATIAMSCGGSRPMTPLTNTSQLDLAISSVTLADDCGSPPTTEPPGWSEPGASSAQKSSMEVSDEASPPERSMRERVCEQSSVQLRVSNGTTAPSAITIRKVELLDEDGKVLGELKSRAPSRWADDDYQPWNEQVAGNQVLQVSYALSAPEVVRGGTYSVRVVIAAGGSERTIEQRKTLEAEASMPPGAVT